MVSYASMNDHAHDLEDKIQPVFHRRFVGLDPLSQSFLKLFIRDVISLEQCSFQEVKDSVGFCFKGHVVMKVEIMGIVVRVDLKDKKHSYVLDDGTGVIMCNQWKYQKEPLPLIATELPTSLQEKYHEIISMNAFKNDGFQLGDLICVRGRVVTYAGKKEIDVLEIYKLENPNCELERVLELPSLYSQCHRRPFELPSKIAENMSNSRVTINFNTVKSKIVIYIGENSTVLNTFTLKDTFYWPSIQSLKAQDEGDINGEDKSLTSLIEAALAAIADTQGLICERSDMNDTYEIIKEGCGLCVKTLKIIRTLCEEKNYIGGGVHLKKIIGILKHSSCYPSVTLVILKKVIQCLENASEIILLDADRYMPVS